MTVIFPLSSGRITNPSIYVLRELERQAGDYNPNLVQINNIGLRLRHLTPSSLVSANLATQRPPNHSALFRILGTLLVSSHTDSHGHPPPLGAPYLKPWLDGRLFSAILSDCGQRQCGRSGAIGGDLWREVSTILTNEKWVRLAGNTGRFVQYFEQIADDCR